MLTWSLQLVESLKKIDFFELSVIDIFKTIPAVNIPTHASVQLLKQFPQQLLPL